MNDKNKCWEDMRIAKEEQYFEEQNKQALEKLRKNVDQTEEVTLKDSSKQSNADK